MNSASHYRASLALTGALNFGLESHVFESSTQRTFWRGPRVSPRGHVKCAKRLFRSVPKWCNTKQEYLDGPHIPSWVITVGKSLHSVPYPNATFCK
ncbi:hypothetical protein RRG08_037056 [Elysia crispata]|uniref:Uncharacterized protein n=1 Tax=Elysia crispata TaxID=231223 RepID=A0AAE0YAD8_9GAST|nr:hypothetical protein RRG08_037056 [Elysia crispata]